MNVEDVLSLECLPPVRIKSKSSFLFPVMITNGTTNTIDRQLSGCIQLDKGLILKPRQSAVIRFKHLYPGQKIILTWILYAQKNGRLGVHIKVRALNKIIAAKTLWIMVQSSVKG